MNEENPSILPNVATDAGHPLARASPPRGLAPLTQSKSSRFSPASRGATQLAAPLGKLGSRISTPLYNQRHEDS
jgi:hypothetical protein